MNSKPVWKIEKIVLPQHADHAGVMWHGTYFNWLEESRINALLKVGVSYFELTKKGLDLPLINTSINYKLPLFLGEKITIESEFNIRKSPKINVISKFLNKKNQTLTIAEVNLVLINKLNFSIIRKRPDFLSEAFIRLNG
ncbi:4-hydroxybenzoyl-CoA thioesterase family active site [Prochlorococcus marinus str. MIT 9302]|uniref:4-hydroxybenzoyl-CoA thioesterase family active site n=1 Tax=Prochlorococcus marinus str. MIT 9302 TaxID=74545 RepID=A0A0A2AEX2_PROMR|nr:acyl-CoA thioesterase [Prochlorococcus marinus]KGF99401.1 4-hydroxybenzoyl-CoA thioesterase family active site [Prochlorococcus marinus str. MIT 9302]